MLTSCSDARVLTELDHARLLGLLRRVRGDARTTADTGLDIGQVLDTADLVPQRDVAPDVVTMYSQVLLAHEPDGTRRKLTLCYPPDAEPDAGFVSVLSPVGAALLGRRVGETAEWRTPAGQTCRAEIVAILFQPEASGDYML